MKWKAGGIDEQQMMRPNCFCGQECLFQWTQCKKKKKSFLNTLIKRLWSAAPLRDQLDHGPKRDRNRNGSHSHSHSSDFTFPWVCFCWFGWLSFKKEWFSTSLDGISIWNQKLPLLTLNISLFFFSTALLQLWSSNVRPKPDQEKQSRAMDSLLGECCVCGLLLLPELGGGLVVDLWQLPHSVGGSTGQMQSWNCSSPRLKHHKQQTHYLPATCQWSVFENMASQTRGQLACVPWSLAST